MKTIAVPPKTGAKRTRADKEDREINDQSASRVDLKYVLAFIFLPLIHRMVDKYGWKEEDAVHCFEDTKLYLYLCATNTTPIAPPPKIDEMWHNFILFTLDYEEFCLTRFGRFIHHRPRRRGESLEGKVLNAASVAVSTFGVISENWGNSGEPSGDCGSCMSCKSCHNCANT